ncbi:MAG: hypothetical protein KDD83_00520, partial [Caldilineaceae bacterium]|nr:hypothetical protein [Caldilineaceae bacterium]
KQSASAALPAPLAQTDSGSPYYDDSCADDPDGDLDGDTLTNLSECLLGTLPSAADSDRDGADDNLEVVGFLYAGRMWYSDPLRTDSNNDGLADGKEWHMDADGNGLPDDTDGDGTPDLWDDDNDGDGVQDSLDLSPYMSTGPGSSSPKIFNSDSPLQITLNDLVVSELTRVEFQVIPGDADHLRLTRMVFDWPENDKQGQIQDADGATFYDVDNSVDPSPNANGDMRLLPALEITMPAGSANLPPSTTCTRDDGSTYTCYPILEDFNISVREVTTGTLVAYVPLQLVADSTGDNAEAFYGRMYYQAASTWGDAHDVRFVWMVQVLNDVCEEYEDNVCSAYSAYNDEQIIHTYPEADWSLSGLHVTEEHEADIALIYEDPTAAANLSGAPADYDKPLYVDALYGLLYGLDSSFLVGRCDEVDSSGKCTDTAQRDMTVDTIGDRFNYATNSGVSSDERWNLPNILSVTKNGVTRAPGDGYVDYAAIPSYASIDLGMLDTTVTQTVTLLDNVFTPVWSASAPVTPTIMLASEQTYRDLNLDAAHVGDNAVQWTGDQALTLDWNGIETDTLASLKWTPYAYDPSDGWAATDLGGYIDDLNLYLAGTLDPDDPSATVMDNMNQLLYSAIFTGNAQIVEIDGEPVEAEGEEEDESIAEELITEIGKMSKEVILLVIEYDETVEEISKALDELESEGYTYTSDTARWVIQYALLKSQGVGLGVYIFEIALLVLDVTALILNNLLQDSPGLEKFNEGLEYTTLVVKAVKKSQQIWQATETIARYSETAEAASETEAVAETLSESATILNLSQVLAGIGFILTLGAAIGTLIYLSTNNDIPAGSPEYTLAVLTTIVSLVLTVTLTVLAIIDPIGAILVAVIGLVDTILKAIGAQWSVFGELATQLTAFVYNYKSIQSISASTGSVGIDYADPDLGLVGDSTVTFSLPITTTYAPVDNCLTVPEDYQETFVRYTLADETQDLDTIDNEGNWNGWRNRTAFDVPAYTQVLESGINREIPLVVNSVSYTAGQNEWWFVIVGSCNLAHNWSTAHVEFGDAYVLDILPPTMDEFLNFADWSNESLAIRNLDADGDGLLATEYGGVDPDDTQWDLDGDTLSDGYELTVRSLTSDQGGVALDERLADTDSDGIRDDRELDWGMDPGVRDTDGDGLYDLEEIAPEGGWMLTYAYDAASATGTKTRVWSDPVRADADGDGMSDLFEQDQITLVTNPWADPTTPRIYSPNVWNESPVALYVDDTSDSGYVTPGATVVISTTTVNNLSSGQELVGELTLAMPAGVSGGPTSQVVDIANGTSGSLISTLTFPAAGSAAYAFSSSMSLTDYDETVWAWDFPSRADVTTPNGRLLDVAAEAVSSWNGSYLVVTREPAQGGFDPSIVGYVLRNDGSLIDRVTIYEEQGVSLTAPALACNEDGVCYVLFGRNSGTSGTVYSVRLESRLEAAYTARSMYSGFPVVAVAIADDGDDFMGGMAFYADSGYKSIRFNTVAIPSTGSPGSSHTVNLLSATVGSMALGWTGSNYTVLWTGDGNVHRADVQTTGAVSNGVVLDAGTGWPQSGGSEYAPVLAYDTVSDQTLVAYRDTTGAIAGRILRADQIGDAFALVESGTDGDGVRVALRADAKNSGWVMAWAAVLGETVEYRALASTGALRGDVTETDIEDGTLESLALTCSVPKALLELKLNEASGTTVFADSSDYDRTITCGDAADAACPQAGYVGENGGAASFNGATTALVADAGIDLTNRSFSLSAWARRTAADTDALILSQGTAGTNTNLTFGFWSSNQFVCNFGNNYVVTADAYTDSTWHHWVCTYDVTTDQRLIYRDGVAVATTSFGDGTGAYVGSGQLNVGRNTNASAYFDGLLDDVIVYDRVLSAKEIQDVFDQTIAVYDLDEATDSKAFVNAADGGFNGTCSGNTCPTMGVLGISYTAAQFDGVDDYIEIPALPEIDTTYQWTFESSDLTNWSHNGTPATVRAQALRDGAATEYLPGNAGSLALPTLTLQDVPAHDQATVTYDLYVIGSGWTGSGMNSDDTGAFAMDVVNQSRQLDTTFSNESGTTVGAYQIYPAERASWDNMATILYGDSSCSGTESYGWNPSNGVTDFIQDTTSELTFRVNCVETYENTVAFLYAGTNFGGTVYKQDPTRGTTQMPGNTLIKSVKVGPAAYQPGHGSTGESLIVGGNSVNSVYQLTSTFDHTANELAVAFDGNSDFGLDNVKVELIKLNNSFALRESSFTLSAWAKRTATGANHTILSQGSAGQLNEQLHMGFRDSDVFTCGFYSDELNTTATYTDSDWHHWVCTYDAAGRLRTIYRDGVQVAQDTAAAQYIGYGATYIGKRQYDGEWYFEGVIDEVGIWGQALSADEVEELYEKVKIEDESVLLCELPVGTTTGQLELNSLTLRETTTRIGEVSQTTVTTITVDADNPTAQVEATAFSQTAPGSYTTSRDVLVIGGAAADATSFIDLVEVNDGNGWASANGTASWSYSWDTSGLADGAQQVQLRATDAVGNVSATTTWHTILDTTGPDLTIDPPGTPVRPDRDADGQWRVPVTGTAVDPAAGSQAGSGVATVQVLFQGQNGRQGQGWQTATLSGDGTWQVDYLVPKFGNGGQPFAGPTGLYTITVRAFDAVGNLSSSVQTPNRPVTLDGTPPQVAADATFSATAVITTAMTLSGVVEDDQTVAAVDVSFIPGAQAAALDGAVLHLPMDDAQAQEYFDDQSGFGNDAVCSAGACPEPAGAGARGGGFAFSGEDTLAVSGLALADTSFTLSVWAKRNAANVAEMILSQGETTDTNQQLHLGFRSDNEFVCGFFGDDLVT